MNHSYEVQTWDDQHKCVRYHSVYDAIDYEDARDFVAGLHPEQKVISVIRRTNDR